MQKKMSSSGYIWQTRMNFPFVVRATVEKVSNEKVGTYETLLMAASVAMNYPHAKIFHSISGKEYLMNEKGEWV